MNEIISIEEFSDLISTLFHGFKERVPWKSFLHRMQDKMDAKFVTFILRPPSIEDSGLFISTGEGDVLDDARTSYNRYFYALDPFIGLPSGQIVTLEEFIPEDERESSEYFQQFLKPIDVCHILGTDIKTKDGAICSIRISRDSDSPPFSEDEKALLALFVPQLECAIDLHMRLNRIETERNVYSGAVDQLAVGTIILDEEGKVLRTNQVAHELIQEKDGLKLVGGILTVGTTSRDTQEFRRLIKQALASQRKGTPSIVEAQRIQRPSGVADLGIVVRSIPQAEWSEGKHRPCVVIFVTDPERQSRAPQEIVKALFDFTPAEAQLAMLLANGLTLDEASDELCISRNTARAHLRSIFSKTGVTRQPMLVRLILRSVASLG